MIFDVYVLGGGDGRFDPVDALRAGPKRGELVIKRRYFNSPNNSLMAEVRDPSTQAELVTAIEHVKVLVADRRGMLLEGTQTSFERDSAKSRRHHFTQRWLIKLPGQPAILDTEKLLKRNAHRIASSMVSGFDPKDDNRTD